MIWRDYVKRNGLRYRSVFSKCLIYFKGEEQSCFIGKGRFYNVIDARVPIIVPHMVLLKITIPK